MVASPYPVCHIPFQLLSRYENDIPPSSFTKDQLNEIRKVSLAPVLCDNSDSIEFVQVALLFPCLFGSVNTLICSRTCSLEPTHSSMH